MELPDWNKGDTLKSIKGVLLLGRQAVAELLERIDTKLANALNGEDDE